MTTLENTLAFKLANEEARELSTRLLNTMYVIYRNNSFITSMSKEEGKIIAAWKLGNKIN